MKEKLKIKFVDFWGDMNNTGNLFCHILSEKYEIEFSDDPEILFYSNGGTNFLKYKCIKIFFSGENVRPDYNVCDYAITFDYSNNRKHCRFPLWALYYWVYINNIKLPSLDLPVSESEMQKNWKAKSKFCCFIVSNPCSNKRNNFFEELSKNKFVDSAGRYKNNIGYFLDGGTTDKLSFIKDYKFVISFENSSHAGYTTEKILEPLLANCIPLYWGDPKVNLDFNKERFLNHADYKNENEFINKILDVDNDDLKAFKILKEKCFNDKSIDRLIQNLSEFLHIIIAERNLITPKSTMFFFINLHKISSSFKTLKNHLRFLSQNLFLKK